MKKLLRRSICGLGIWGPNIVSSPSPVNGLNARLLMCFLMLGMAISGCGSSEIDMGSVPEENESVLFTAIGAGDLETVKAEIARDASLLNQFEGSFLQTPLHKAVRNKQLEIARFLIESGAEVNTFDNYSRTPLATAIDVEAGAEMVQLLESYGADD